MTRRVLLALAGVCLLAGPTVLAFFSGGYFPRPRLVAGIVVWLLVLGLALVGPAPLPRALPGRLAVAGLAALAGWSALSIMWAPQAGPATQNVQRLVLYVGALLLAVGVLRVARAQRVVEPALAAGAAVVLGYGLSGRLLPDVVHLDRSESAGGRLEQPLTYWNAEGALAAMGLVLCARLAGDVNRPRPIRLTAAAAMPVLGAGLYLTYSRGALAVAALGLLVLVAAVPSRLQLRAAALGVAATAAVAAISELLPGVSELAGSERTRDGAVFLAALLVSGAATALGMARTGHEPGRIPRWHGRVGQLAWVATGAVVAGLLIGGLAERPSGRELSATAGAQRLTTVSSNRYEYWRVAMGAFRDEPLTGVGSGGFRVVWLQERPIAETVRDAHSIEVEIAAELGIVGLLAVALMAGGTAVAARRALTSRRSLAAGPVAALVAWSLHASIDWDWQMPAVTLPAIVLAGLLISVADEPSGAPR